MEFFGKRCQSILNLPLVLALTGLFYRFKPYAAIAFVLLIVAVGVATIVASPTGTDPSCHAAALDYFQSVGFAQFNSVPAPKQSPELFTSPDVGNQLPVETLSARFHRLGRVLPMPVEATDPDVAHEKRNTKWHKLIGSHLILPLWAVSHAFAVCV